MPRRLALLAMPLALAGCRPAPPAVATPRAADATAAARPARLAETSPPPSPAAAAAPKVARPAGPTVRVESGVRLWNEYQANAASADAKYTGRLVETAITGRVEKDAEGYFVGMKTVQPPPRGSAYDVVFRISSESAKAAAAVGGGDDMLVRGICRGSENNPRAWSGITVTVDDCNILKSGKWPLEWPAVK